MVLTENNPSVNTCSCMCTALRVHVHIFTICCIQCLSKMLKIYFGKRLLHAYEYLRSQNYDPVMMCEVPFVHGFVVEFLDFHAILNLAHLLQKGTAGLWRKRLPSGALLATTGKGKLVTRRWEHQAAQQQPPLLHSHNRGRGTLKPQTLTVPAQHGSSSQAVPCWAPGPRAEREPSTASIRVTQLLNKLWIKERKEFCLHDNGKACAYISKSLLTSADLCLSWSGWRISARVHTTACSQHPSGPEPSRAIRAGHPPSLTLERWRQSKIKSFFRKYLQCTHPGSAQGPFGWLHAF